jgi:benzil reductase ((S)-benzoin forming)
MRYVEVLIKTYNEGDRTFYDAINIDKHLFVKQICHKKGIRMRYYIITGSSKGIGEYVAKELLVKGNHLLCLSRGINESLINAGKEKAVALDYQSVDLNNVTAISDIIQSWAGKIDPQLVEGLYLINNAGLIDPIKPVYKCDPEEIIRNINVNLIAPVILQSEFLKVCESINRQLGKKVTQRILNISSGAGRKAIQGWGVYCTSKAGLDMFSNCLDADMKEANKDVRIVSLAPGIVDTNLQETIRSSNDGDFALVNQFREFRDNGKLLSPAFVGQEIVRLLHSDDFGKEIIMRITDIN